MAKKSDRLTERQIQVIETLKGHSGAWMTANDIWDAQNPGCTPEGSEIGSMGCVMVRLPEKEHRVQKRWTSDRWVYRWSELPQIDADECVQSPQTSSQTGTVAMDIFTVNGDIFVPSSDAQIIADALMVYANSMVRINPEAALRAAYLAGQGALCDNTKPVGKTKRASPRPAAQSTCEVGGDTDTDPAVEPVPMPAEMTYPQFVEKALRAYANLEFNYETAAKRCGVDEGYLRRVVQGDATPSRDTLEKIYPAIFAV